MASSIYTKLFNVKSAWIKLQRDTPAFNYKYATLDQIQSKLGDILQKEKLVVIHFVKDWHLITQIRDIESNEFVESSIELTTTRPQDKWSEITYFRRYNLLSLLDLEVEDDDWQQAQNSINNLPWIWEDVINKIATLISEWKTITMQDIKKKYRVSKANAKKLYDLWIK
jgi:hypothetical protein